MPRGRLLAATLSYLAVVASITLGPQPLDSGMISALANAIEFFAASAPLALGYADAEFMANVAMFVPFGILVARWAGGRRWLLTLASGFLLSAGVEIAQLAIPGRVSDPRDLVANTIGATLGILLLAAHSAHARFIRARR